MHIPRIAQPLFMKDDTSNTFVGYIKSVDTVPVAAQDVFRVVVRDMFNRRMVRFDLHQSDYSSLGIWLVEKDSGTIV